MGIDLDVLVGHPEHELLFVATQVGRAAGLKNPSQQVMRQSAISGPKQTRQFGSIPGVETLKKPMGVQATSWLFTETAVYALLLRGHAPQSEPFRRWVTEEVLPAIRKTGRYDASESTNPIAQAVMDELKTLRAEVANLNEAGTLATRSLKI